MKFILFVGAAQAYFWLFLIFKKPQKQFTDRLLQITMFFAGTFILIDFLQETSFNYRSLPHLPILNACIPLLFGPFLLLYIQHYGERKAINWLHFLPFCLALFLFLPFLVKTPQELLFHLDQISEGKIPTPIQHWIYEIMIVSSGIAYVIWCWIALNKHQKKVYQEFSDTQKINFLWLKKLLIGAAFVWIVVIAVFSIGWFFGLVRTGLFGNIIPACVTAFVFFFGYNGIKQGNIFFTLSALPQTTSSSSSKKYERSGLKDDKALQMAEDLKKFMQFQKPWLDNTLNLARLAEMTSIPANHLSQILNEHLSCNFYEFVNRYRLEEFKKRVEQDTQKQFTYLAHALDSGFGSKSTFNEIFRKFEHMSPGEYFRTRKIPA